MSVPGAPNIKTLPLARPQALTFGWAPPTSDGGSPITGYRLVLNPGALTYTPGPEERTYTVSGLTNGTTYFATLEAQNANGYGPAATFRPFQPGSRPTEAPATATAQRQTGNSTALVSWTPPSVLPDATIFWYTIRSYSDNPADSTIKITANGQTQSNYIVRNLNPSSIYSFDVRAVNCPGYGPRRFTSTIGPLEPPFSPSSIGTMQAWFDAADAGTITQTSGRVTTWADKSGRGVNITGTTSTGPTYTTSNINFASGQRMTMNIPFTTQHTVFFVATKNSGDFAYTFYRSLAPNYAPAILTSPTGTSQVRYFNAADDQVFAATADPQFIASYTYNEGVNVTGYYNATQAFSITQSQTGNGTVPYDELNFGSYVGSVKEIITYSTVLASSNISSVHGYLRAKWGI